MANKKEEMKCSFCGRSEHEVDLLMPGLNGCICNECAERASEIAHEYLNKIADADSS
jgi:ATP-dependent Clp protease ATP-binding subunit ClpX